MKRNKKFFCDFRKKKRKKMYIRFLCLNENYFLSNDQSSFTSLEYLYEGLLIPIE